MCWFIFKKVNIDVHSVGSVLLVHSCNVSLGERIRGKVEQLFSNAQVAHVVRDQYPELYQGKELFDSTIAVSFHQKVSFIRTLRRKKFDVIVVCWTNEEEFRNLKILPLFLRGKSVLVFNENTDCFWVSRENVKVLFGHIQWRLRERKVGDVTFLDSISNLLTLIVLTPIGILFVLIRTCYYCMKKMFLHFFHSYRV